MFNRLPFGGWPVPPSPEPARSDASLRSIASAVRRHLRWAESEERLRAEVRIRTDAGGNIIEYGITKSSGSRPIR